MKEKNCTFWRGTKRDLILGERDERVAENDNRPGCFACHCAKDFVKQFKFLYLRSEKKRGLLFGFRWNKREWDRWIFNLCYFSFLYFLISIMISVDKDLSFYLIWLPYRLYKHVTACMIYIFYYTFTIMISLFLISYSFVFLCCMFSIDKEMLLTFLLVEMTESILSFIIIISLYRIKIHTIHDLSCMIKDRTYKRKW